MSTTVSPSAGGPSLDGGSDDITQDVAFKMLSSRRRRHVIHYLLQREDDVSLHELSKRLAAWENDVPYDEVTYKQRMRVYTALRQSHLPKMDDEGLVEFDPDAGETRLTDEATKLEVYLDIVPHDEIPWSSYYLGLGVLSGVVVAVAWIGLFPFDVLPGITWSLVVTALFAGSAVAHRRHDRRNRLGAEGSPPV